jgi:hypothetical protein
MAYRTRRTTRKAPVTKAAFRSKITKKQAQFKRFKKRFATTNSVSVKRFCKTEAARIVKVLNTFKKQWKSYGFGACMFITNNYNMTSFVRGSNKKSVSRFNSRRTARRTNTWNRKARRSNVRKTRRSYAW